MAANQNITFPNLGFYPSEQFFDPAPFDNLPFQNTWQESMPTFEGTPVAAPVTMTPFESTPMSAPGPNKRPRPDGSKQFRSKGVKRSYKPKSRQPRNSRDVPLENQHHFVLGHPEEIPSDGESSGAEKSPCTDNVNPEFESLFERLIPPATSEGYRPPPLQLPTPVRPFAYPQVQPEPEPNHTWTAQLNSINNVIPPAIGPPPGAPDTFQVHRPQPTPNQVLYLCPCGFVWNFQLGIVVGRLEGTLLRCKAAASQNSTVRSEGPQSMAAPFENHFNGSTGFH